VAALGQTDYRVNSIQDVIQGSNPNTPAAVNAQLDVWNTSSQAPFTMTYQFETAQPGDLWMSYSGWTAMSGAEQAAIRSVLDEYESVANVKFVLDNSLADPDINFGKVGLSAGVGGIGGWNFSFSYDGNNNITSRVMDHFAVFNNTLDLTAAANRSLLLHEIGHAMTLKHPGPYDVEGVVPPGPYLPTAEDSNKYTVMSYTANPDNGVKSDHLMLYDIAALQARWGVNTSYHTGNDTYTAPSGTIQSIWDAGGTDTIDGSGKQQAVTIDLHDGAFSSLGALNNFSIAFGALIENAVGSAFADTITGNDVANLLRGGGGNDTVDGAGGDDTYVLSGLRSQYTVTMLSATSARLVDNRPGSADGTDVISNIEHVQFADGTVNFSDLPNVAGSVSINDVSITEGNNGTQTLIFTVTRSGGTTAFSVSYATADGTATTADGDYGANSNTLQFAANENTKTVSIAINGDTKAEGNETFTVNLSNATNGATIADGQGVGTINNDDSGTIVSSVSYTLGPNDLNLVLTGAADLQGYGNAANNVINGNSGNNLIDGGAGADSMFGGAGNDAYFVDNAGDTATENANEGNDTVYATAHFRLSADVENLVLQGGADLQGYGNSSTNVIYGNAGNNILDGGAGSDAMYGGAGNDTYYVDNAADGVFENPGEGTDTVYSTAHLRLGANLENLVLQGGADLQGYGNSLSNAIYGTSGINILDGDAGADSMYGGAGNDTYYVDNAGDVLVEDVNAGFDTVFSTVGLTLTANLENLVLQGSADLQGYGNSLSNAIYGNAGNNILDGGAGADAMYGGAGNDVYYVDNAGDVVIENAAAGTDAVFSTVSYTLTANVETLVLQGGADLQGYGSAQANTIYGNAGNNLIDGGGGADTMIGGAGNDNYFVDNASDSVVENASQGNDAVFSTVTYALTANVETLVLQGSGNINGTGNTLANSLFGNSGVNRLDGGAGADSLTGNAGDDVFVFQAGQASGDAIVDFTGNGAAAGDSLQFLGFGTAAQGATFTQIGASNQWQIHSGLDAHNETITLSNSATVHANDFLFS